VREAGTHPQPTRGEDAYAQLVGTVAIAALRCGLILWRHEGGQGSLARLVAEQFEAIVDGLGAPSARTPEGFMLDPRAAEPAVSQSRRGSFRGNP
jgi:hypothetical protein